MPILLGLLSVLLVMALLKGYTKASPALLASAIKRGGGLFVLALSALLMLRGRLDFGLALGGLGLWLLGVRGSTTGLFGGGGNFSRVRSAMIEMTLNHTTGGVSGVVLAGRYEGKQIDALPSADVLQLYAVCREDDPDGARLLEVYLDRRFPGWRQTGQAHGDASRSGASQGHAARRSGSISEDEAYEILGLKKGAPARDITRAHRDLMKKFHPDLGGATDLAARVNEAKDVLMRRRHG
jgi:hypothetical protein